MAYLVSIVLILGDVLTTVYALEAGGAQEANPLARWAFGAIGLPVAAGVRVLVGGGVALVAAAGTLRLGPLRRYQELRSAHWLFALVLVGQAVMVGITVWHNLYYI